MDIVIKEITSFFESKCISLEVIIIEDFNGFEISITANDFKENIETNLFEHFFRLINHRDRATVVIDPDGADRIYNSSPQEIELESINTMLKIHIDEDDKGYDLKIKYLIEKKHTNHTLSIYSLSHFYHFINSKGLKGLLTIYQDIFLNNMIKTLEIQKESSDIYFQSALFSITTKNTIVKSNNVSMNFIQRNNILFQRNKYTNPHNFVEYKLLPSDFENNILNVNIEVLSDLLSQFDTLKCVLSSSFLANTSRINNKDFEMSIFEENYLHISNNFKQLSVNNAKSFYDVYLWVYENEFSIEKLTIAKHIIGQKFTENNKNWALPNDILHSIKSAYSIHLKRNVEKYFETINKVTELVTEMSINNKEIVKQTANSFKNNNITLLSFFASIFIFNSLSNDFHKPIFNIEKYFLSMIFILISALYLWASYKQYRIERKNNIKHFYSIKHLYKKPLQQEDLDKLFNKRHFKKGLKSADKISISYFGVWILEIYIFFFLVIGLTFFKL